MHIICDFFVGKFGGLKKSFYLCRAKAKRAFSSAGSEHLPYKQRVGGSNPSTPTKESSKYIFRTLLFFTNISYKIP